MDTDLFFSHLSFPSIELKPPDVEFRTCKRASPFKNIDKKGKTYMWWTGTLNGVNGEVAERKKEYNIAHQAVYLDVYLV